MSLSHPPFKNRILAALPNEDLQLLLPHLQQVELKKKQVLCDIGQTFDFVYFIEQGVTSFLTTMKDGASIEVGMIGYEGATPLSPLFGEQSSQHHIVTQLPGRAAKIEVRHCMAAFEKSPALRQGVLYFTNSFLNQGAQTAACIRLHSVEQRLARWLLMSGDRFQSATLPLTQEFLSIMLGVRRAGVSEAASEIQRSGLITYTHGQITICDREGLEKMACECYGNDRKR
ncbi:MAG: transcriptional regulator, Crp/Fnr family, partial [Alphaproteobacteria bacterium]|nr:transcriptional regulator, Crp/Fnr family [Alphaproteobacteria bacterium]